MYIYNRKYESFYGLLQIRFKHTNNFFNLTNKHCHRLRKWIFMIGGFPSPIIRKSLSYKMCKLLALSRNVL